jgi:hypothetical protein
MHAVVQELERNLNELDSVKAQELTAEVRDAIKRAKQQARDESKGWPPGYFEKYAGALQGERFERPDQGEFPVRENW